MIGQKDKVLPGSGIRIKIDGKCNFEKLYEDMKSFFDEHDYDFLEKEHTEKDLPQGRELIIVWTAEREVDDYAKYDIKVRFFIENFRKEGSVCSGNFEIKMWATITFDYKNNWQGNPITEFLFKIYNSYIIKEKILNNYEPKLESEIEELKSLIKEHIK